MWIARDEDNTLWAYKEKPTKYADDFGWSAEGIDFCRIFDWMVPDIDIKWSDDEPTEVKLIKK